ncbi:transcription factor bHLH [Quillaja saponaria]|uniref:Transcription factor bHLH n=1 Tax=Quillaja saponaria TaxID=32244 RepID=A0AAD7Q6B2_QUISA|nr:transcription factor bHLH [Quillaja saponaria]
MFPSHQGNELFIQFSSDPINQQQQQHKISEDLILLDHHHHQASFGVINDDSTENLGIKPRRRGFNKSYSTNSANDSKKMLHRDIERQRRQEMSTLYKSLRSLLPFELIKGKRSMSDHMNEAVNYIKLLQNNIEEKGAKRDELKNLSSTLNTVDHYGNGSGSGSGSGSSNSCLTVYQSSSGGVEIEITSSSRQVKLPLSRILEVLLEEGLEVVNCVSTKVNGRFLHSIQSEVMNAAGVDVAELKIKLANVIPSMG